MSKHPSDCDCWECRTGWQEVIKGYERCIKHHQKYIDEFQARIEMIRKEHIPLVVD